MHNVQEKKMHAVPTFAEGVIPARSITIKDNSFTIPSRYNVGDTLDVHTANALNAALVDSIRSTFTNHVKKLSEANVTPAEIEAAFAAFLSNFSFTTRATRDGASREDNAIDALAQRIARAMVRQLLQKKGVKVRTVATEKLNELASALLARNPKLRDEAQRQYEEEKTLATETFDLDIAA